GDLDLTFGHSGTLVQKLGGDVHYPSIAVQRDGKYVVAATVSKGGSSKLSLVVERMTPAGKLDASFGTSGKASLSIGEHNSMTSIAIDSQGRIDVLAGGRIRRFSTSGKLDKTVVDAEA